MLMASDQKDSLKLELVRIRARAVARLVTLTALPAEDCGEAYLFENDRFCGVRWTLGNAKAIWRSGSEDITFKVDGKSITIAAAESAQQTPPVKRAA